MHNAITQNQSKLVQKWLMSNRMPYVVANTTVLGLGKEVFSIGRCVLVCIYFPRLHGVWPLRGSAATTLIFTMTKKLHDLQ